MCRLFGLAAAPHRIHASFWLLEAPDSLVSQSHRNPDGTGIGFFDPDGAPVLDKEPVAAFEDASFAREARHVSSTTFVSHIRFATTGEHTVPNTHPFTMDGRVFAHNGVVRGLDRLEAELGDDLGLRPGRDGLRAELRPCHARDPGKRRRRRRRSRDGAGWIARNLPVYSINCLLATEHELWALRYPETHHLYVLEREAGGSGGEQELHHVSTELRVHSRHLADRPSVVVASEPLDDHPEWRPLESGELLHVGPDLALDSAVAVDFPPAEPIHIDHSTGQSHS